MRKKVNGLIYSREARDMKAWAIKRGRMYLQWSHLSAGGPQFGPISRAFVYTNEKIANEDVICGFDEEVVPVEVDMFKTTIKEK